MISSDNSKNTEVAGTTVTEEAYAACKKAVTLRRHAIESRMIELKDLRSEYDALKEELNHLRDGGALLSTKKYGTDKIVMPANTSSKGDASIDRIENVASGICNTIRKDMEQLPQNSLFYLGCLIAIRFGGSDIDRHCAYRILTIALDRWRGKENG